MYHIYKSVPFTEKQLRKPETGIKDGFQEMDDNKYFHFELSFWKNMATLISDVPLLLEIFCSIVFHLLSNQIFFKLFVNDKQPMLTITVKPFFQHLVQNVKWIFIVFISSLFDTTI